jgi:hypothetical protein
LSTDASGEALRAEKDVFGGIVLVEIDKRLLNNDGIIPARLHGLDVVGI